MRRIDNEVDSTQRNVDFIHCFTFILNLGLHYVLRNINHLLSFGVDYHTKNEKF